MATIHTFENDANRKRLYMRLGDAAKYLNCDVDLFVHYANQGVISLAAMMTNTPVLTSSQKISDWISAATNTSAIYNAELQPSVPLLEQTSIDEQKNIEYCDRSAVSQPSDHIVTSTEVNSISETKILDKLPSHKGRIFRLRYSINDKQYICSGLWKINQNYLREIECNNTVEFTSRIEKITPIITNPKDKVPKLVISIDRKYLHHIKTRDDLWITQQDIKRLRCFIDEDENQEEINTPTDIDKTSKEITIRSGKDNLSKIILILATIIYKKNEKLGFEERINPQKLTREITKEIANLINGKNIDKNTNIPESNMARDIGTICRKLNIEDILKDVLDNI